MTDELLTPDDLRAIEARAEAYEKASEAYTEACATTLWLSTPKTRDAEYDARIALDRAEDEFDTHAHADIPALLAHIRAQDAENARLREALALACAALERVQPQTRGALVVEDVAQAISAARALLDGGADSEGGA